VRRLLWLIPFLASCGLGQLLAPRPLHAVLDLEAGCAPALWQVAVDDSAAAWRTLPARDTVLAGQHILLWAQYTSAALPVGVHWLVLEVWRDTTVVLTCTPEGSP